MTFGGAHTSKLRTRDLRDIYQLQNNDSVPSLLLKRNQAVHPRIIPHSLVFFFVFFCPTWDDGNSVSLPGHDADVLLHGGGDEALEHSYVAPHRTLVRHPHGVGLPENYKNTQRKLILEL